MPLSGRWTLTRYLIEERRRYPGASGDFNALLLDVALACKAIARIVAFGPLADALGTALPDAGAVGGQTNVQGEVQKPLDVISNEIFVRMNEWNGHLAGMASEEMEQPAQIPANYQRGKYLLVFDPLDGSSNIDVNVSVGSIFSILRAPEEVIASGRDVTEADFLQPGATQMAAGYAIYGPTTMLVLSVGNGVAGFTLNPNLGEFVLSHPNIRIPEDTTEFAINTSNSRFWEPPVKRYVDECLAGRSGPRGRDFNMRWIASMVAEAHRILMRGGVFMYPRDTKDPQHRPAAGAGRQAERAAPAHRPGLRQPQRGRAHRALPPRAGFARPRRAAVRRTLALQGLNMSERHPIIAITGSSGAGTSSVTRTFENIFRRENVSAAIIEGDSFHRYDRKEMRARQAEAEKAGNKHFSHFGSENNLFAELEQLFRSYSESGTGKRRRYLHDPVEAAPYKQEPGTFTPWEDLPAQTDLLFYEGLHGAVKTPEVDVARYPDLLIGVVPVINLEWIQKLYRDKNVRGYSAEAVTDTILRRMPDYVNYIVPQFAHTHVNFQRVPVVDTSNPFIARDIPTADESLCVIRFSNPKGIDFPYLLSMIHDSWMSRANTLVVPGGKMELAMQLIFTPYIWRMLERRKRALGAL